MLLSLAPVPAQVGAPTPAAKEVVRPPLPPFLVRVVVRHVANAPRPRPSTGDARRAVLVGVPTDGTLLLVGPGAPRRLARPAWPVARGVARGGVQAVDGTVGAASTRARRAGADARAVAAPRPGAPPRVAAEAARGGAVAGPRKVGPRVAGRGPLPHAPDVQDRGDTRVGVTTPGVKREGRAAVSDGDVPRTVGVALSRVAMAVGRPGAHRAAPRAQRLPKVETGRKAASLAAPIPSDGVGAAHGDPVDASRVDGGETVHPTRAAPAAPGVETAQDLHGVPIRAEVVEEAAEDDAAATALGDRSVEAVLQGIYISTRERSTPPKEVVEAGHLAAQVRPLFGRAAGLAGPGVPAAGRPPEVDPPPSTAAAPQVARNGASALSGGGGDVGTADVAVAAAGSDRAGPARPLGARIGD